MTLTVMGESGAPTSDPEAMWLIDAIDRYIVSAERPRYRPGWFSASQLGRTDEELIADYRGVYAPEQRTAREYRIFHNGTSRDEDYKRYLADAGLSMVADESAREIVIPWLRLRGTLDDIAIDDQMQPWVVEFKTINPFQYGRLLGPKPEHVLQVHAYMSATTIHRSIILYENKADQALRGFYVPWNEEIWQGIVQRLQQLRRDAEALDAAMDPAVLQASRQLAQELAGDGLRAV
jgi:hypothetical protein